MTKRYFLEILLKVLGLYSLILLIDNLPLVARYTYIFFYSSSDDINPTVLFAAYIIKTFLYLIIFLIFTFKTTLISKKLVNKDSETIKISINKRDFLQVLFIVIGIILVLYELTQFFQQLAWTNALVDYDFVEISMRGNYFIFIFLISLIKLILGLIFIVFSYRISLLFERMDKD